MYNGNPQQNFLKRLYNLQDRDFPVAVRGLKLDLSHDKDKITWEFGEHVTEEKMWTSEERWGKSESVTSLIEGVDADESYLSHHIVVYRLVTPVQLHLFQNAIGALAHYKKGLSCAYCQGNS
jgi:hypothetical protein